MAPPRDQENTGGGTHTGLAATTSTAPTSQTEGLQVLLSLAISPQRHYPAETGVRDGRALALSGLLHSEQDAAGVSPAPGAPRERRASRARPGGRHAAPPPPYLERRAARFAVFSAIGGFVFLMGFGLQAVLTGSWHVLPVASYADPGCRLGGDELPAEPLAHLA